MSNRGWRGGGLPPGFERFLRHAQALIRDPDATARLGEDAQARLRRHTQALDGVVDQLATLIRLVQHWARGEYTEVSVRAMVAVIAAILYFVVPIDFVPDFLFGFGLLDDIAVISWAFEHVRSEVEAFRRWEKGMSDARDVKVTPTDEPAHRDAADDDIEPSASPYER